MKLVEGTLMFFGPGGLRAPCVLACAMHSLAIVITNFLFFFFFLSHLPCDYSGQACDYLPACSGVFGLTPAGMGW